jgi:predicted N-acetyltransferase YhbS
MDVRTYRDADAGEVIEVWNRSARGRTLYHPLTAAKLRAMFLGRPEYDPDGFLLAADRSGIAGGILVSARRVSAQEPTALLFGLFDRTGEPGEGMQAALDAGLAYVEARGATRLRTHATAAVDARDLPLLGFLWHNRFFNGTVRDGVIEEDVADQSIFLGRDLECYSVPSSIEAVEKELQARGYRFTFDVTCDTMAERLVSTAMPFQAAFLRTLREPSPHEHLLLAFHEGRPVGGAMVTMPGGGHDWVNYGCECGLFGPLGVAREHRGGVGKVLLFRAVERLRELHCRHAIIPAAASIIPFYAKAGFRLERVLLNMQRRIGRLPLNVR